MAQEIVFYHSAMQGAPSSTLTTPGAALAVLDACLVDGFNVNSISVLTQAAGIATATTSGTNGYSIGDWIEVAGATPAAYNGRVKVTGKPATNQFTYAVPGGTASPASGTMTAKYPGAGWTKTVAGTNIAAYHAGAGLGLWMQVEDNNPYADGNVGMRTRLAQGWTALDTGTVLGAQINTHKATGGWMVIADAKTAYVFFGPLGGTVKSFHFGEFTPFYVGDAFSAFQANGRSIGSSTAHYDEAGTNQGTDFVGSQFPTANGGTLDLGQSAHNLRGISQIGGIVNCSATMLPGTNHGYGGAGYAFTAQDLLMPSLADNTLPVSPIFNVENGGGSSLLTLRGKFRGMHWPLGKLSSGFANGHQRLDAAVLDGVSQSALLVQCSLSGNRQLVFQVDGAWPA